MRQRAKFALQDIRYIQTEIQKILNRDKQKQKTPKRKTKQKKQTSQGKNKLSLISGSRSNYSTSPLKPKSKGKEKSLSNDKSNSMRRKKKKKIQSDEQVDPFFKYLQMRSIPEEKHSKRQKEQKIKVQIFEQPVKPKPQPLKKSIMDLWKQREKQSSQFNQNNKNTITSKQNTIKKVQFSQSFQNKTSKQSPQTHVENTSPRRYFQTESIDESSQVIVLEKSGVVPYHLNPKNEIPLRSDTKYLIKKYHPDDPPSARGEELRERYWKLDQRLQRLQQQVRNRPTLPWNEPHDSENQRQQKKAKKYALADYYHHSPILKFVRINQKLRGDYQRSPSNQQRRARQKSQDLRPQWVS